MAIDDDAVAVVLDPRTVKKLDLNTGQFAWEYRESEKMPDNGPPRLVGGAGMVLILHEGRTLIRLDPATGSKCWSCLLGLDDLSRRPAAMAHDDRRFYCVSRFMSRVTLKAIALEGGTPAWTSEWTTGSEDSSWSLDVAGDHVFTFPVPPVQGKGVDMESLPVIVRRRDTGVLVQRMIFPARGKVAENPMARDQDRDADAPAVAFNLDNLGAVVATPRGVWGLGGRGGDSPAAPH